MKKITAILLCTSLSASHPITARQQVIIDCDPGGDDALALILAAKCPQLDIKAITTLAGNVPLAAATANTLYILHLLGESTIPVYAGAKNPLTKTLKSDYFFGEHGLGPINVQKILEDATTDTPAIKTKKAAIKSQIKKALAGNAIDMMLSIIKANPNEVSIIALGPLTNIAKAIEKDTQTMKLAKEIIIAGGAINVPGNITPVAEFNFYVDPEAVQIVFNADIRKKMVASDTVYEVNYTWKELLSTLGETSIPLTDPCTGKIITVKEFIANMLSFKNAPVVAVTTIFDPIAIYATIHPDNVTYNTIALDIKNSNEKETRAQLSVKKTAENNTAHPIDLKVASKIDKTAFQNFLIECLQKK